MSDNRRPMIWSRVPADDLERFQRVAERHYDGNLSQFLRKAARDLAAYHDDADRRAALQAAAYRERELVVIS